MNKRGLINSDKYNPLKKSLSIINIGSLRFS